MIDVIIPTYNNGKYIKDALESISKQTLPVNNVFVIDDGSTDNTEEIIQKYKAISSIPLTYIKKENGGPNSARNIGLMHSIAPFIAFLDADDVWAPYKLEEQIRIFTESTFKNVGLVYGAYDTIDTEGNPSPAKALSLDTRYRGNAYQALLEANKILGSASCVLIKKEVFNTVGVFDEKLRFAEDWEMWLRISEKYSIDYSNKVLVHIRRHPLNTSNSRMKQIIGFFKFYKKLLFRTKNLFLVIKLIIKKMI